MLDTPCSEVVWRVLVTNSILQFPLHFSSRASPCAITFQLESAFRKAKATAILSHGQGLRLVFRDMTLCTLVHRCLRAQCCLGRLGSVCNYTTHHIPDEPYVHHHFSENLKITGSYEFTTCMIPGGGGGGLLQGFHYISRSEAGVHGLLEVREFGSEKN